MNLAWASCRKEVLDLNKECDQERGYVLCLCANKRTSGDTGPIHQEVVDLVMDVPKLAVPITSLSFKAI